MTRVAAGVFLLLHAVITAAIWIPPQRGSEMRGWGWQGSWLFADSRPTMVTLGVLASAAIGIAGLGVIVNQDWWVAAVVINLVVVYAAWSSMTTQLSGR